MRFDILRLMTNPIRAPMASTPASKSAGKAARNFQTRKVSSFRAGSSGSGWTLGHQNGHCWFRNPLSNSTRPATSSWWSMAQRKVELRRVTTGIELGRNVVVTDGLKEGELVIVEGIQKVHAGQVVSANVPE